MAADRRAPKRASRRTGGDPSEFGLEAQVDVGDGAPETWVATIESWRALGASHVRLRTMDGGLAGPDAHIERQRQAAEALGLGREPRPSYLARAVPGR